MSWNPSLSQHFDWPHLLGYHLNVAPDAMTVAAAIAVVQPTSPEMVWAGDPGVPRTLPVIDAETGDKVGSTANPAWSAAAPDFETVFCLFVDLAEARALLPELWTDTPPLDEPPA